MSLKSLTLATAAVLALGGASFAATTTTTTKPAATTTTAAQSVGKTGSVAASKATTEVEKAVGAGDTFSADDLKEQVALSKVKDAKDKLASAKVDDPKGNIIGPVKDVVTGKSGMATAIHVDVGGWLGVGERVVSITAKNFTYIPDRGILLTKLSKSAIEKLPALKKS